jgi:hypothetical protein
LSDPPHKSCKDKRVLPPALTQSFAATLASLLLLVLLLRLLVVLLLVCQRWPRLG